MPNDLEKKKLIDALDRLTEETTPLKEEMNKSNSKKEVTFTKKKEAGKEIVDLISKVKQLKKQRDEKTRSVKDGKEKRQILNSKIKGKVAFLKELQAKKDAILKKGDRRESPKRLKKEIEDIEYKIETEGMGFEKEQKLMKEINTLKKKLGNVKDTGDVFEKLRETQRDVRTLRKEANIVHKSVQKDADESQNLHEDMIKVSKKIDDLKKEEKNLLNVFIKEKDEYTKINNKLKEKLDEMAKIRSDLKKFEKKVKEKKEKKVKKSLKEKTEEVEEKIKKGKKLTTEDLLIMQSGK
ncbi:hypothetical protein GOV08_03920 [Candidatus Woesearchaeota archaeon]|nr:hypothetical protein [Candidatus Woesearchaeota archaeon]